MDNTNRAVEIGQRCRRIRMAKGMSQQDLADRAGTTPQNVSKFEKNGISDIYWIEKLSECLGQNLLTDEIDEEGKVGEIGKEILFRLVYSKGSLFFEDLFKFLHGLDSERISNEIFKLEKIGLVVREQYTDWYASEVDRVFITAKGIITIKNMDLNSALSEEIYKKLDSVRSYEDILYDEEWYEGYSNYQDLIDNNESIKVLKGINYQIFPFRQEGSRNWTNTPYRINYIEWLKKRYDKYDGNSHIYNGAIPCEGCYYDIIYRMTFGITNEYLMTYYMSEKVEDAYRTIGRYVRRYLDPVKENAKELFEKKLIPADEINLVEKDEVFDQINSVKYSMINEILKKTNIDNESLMDILRSDKIKDLDYPEDVIDLIQQLYEFCTACDITVDACLLADARAVFENEFYKRVQNGESQYPTDWFSYEEIKKFIDENMGPAQTEEERRIDELLKSIEEDYGNTLEYYSFPREWEENGLADRIRKNYGLPTKPKTE